jgi:hypothetical protein
MKFSCHKCRCPQPQMYYVAYLERKNQPVIGFLCPSCHDQYSEDGRIIGYIAKQETFRWVHQAVSLRSFKDTFGRKDFNYREIVAYSSVPRGALSAKLEHLADIHACLASSHGYNSCIEGWLFNLSTKYICTLLNGTKDRPLTKSHQSRIDNVLAFHERLKCMAIRNCREGVIEALLGIIAAILCSDCRPERGLSSKDLHASRQFLKQLPGFISNRHWAYQSLQGLATNNPWVIFLMINLDYLPIKDLNRIIGMLLNSIQISDFYRKEAVLRSIHWQILLANQSQIPSSRIM